MYYFKPTWHWSHTTIDVAEPQTSEVTALHKIQVALYLRCWLLFFCIEVALPPWKDPVNKWCRRINPRCSEWPSKALILSTQQPSPFDTAQEELEPSYKTQAMICLRFTRMQLRDAAGPPSLQPPAVPCVLTPPGLHLLTASNSSGT